MRICAGRGTQGERPTFDMHDDNKEIGWLYKAKGAVQPPVFEKLAPNSFA